MYLEKEEDIGDLISKTENEFFRKRSSNMFITLPPYKNLKEDTKETRSVSDRETQRNKRVQFSTNQTLIREHVGRKTGVIRGFLKELIALFGKKRVDSICYINRTFETVRRKR